MVLASVVGLLAGCEGPGASRPGPTETVTWIIESTPAYVRVGSSQPIPDIVLGRQPPYATAQQIADRAQEYCSQHGKNARRNSSRYYWGGLEVTFDCVR